MAAKRPAHTDGGPDGPLKKKAKGSPVYDRVEKRTTKAAEVSTRSNNRGGPDSSGLVRAEDRAETYLLYVDSDATDYDTNATISERLWISDAEEEEEEEEDNEDDDDDDWKQDKDGRVEEPWHDGGDDNIGASPGTGTEEEAVRSPPPSQGPGSSPAPKLEYDKNISSPDGELFLKNEWYWDEAWDESWDWYDSSYLSQETSCCSAAVEPPALLAPVPSPEQQQQQLDDDLGQDLAPWSAPPEPSRPLHPYTKGQTLEIWRHEAAPPFYQDLGNGTSLDDITLPAGPGAMLSQQRRVPVSDRELRATTVVELCLHHPPLAGKTRTEDGPRRLTIVDTIHAKDGEGAQVVVCRLDVDVDVNGDEEDDDQGSREYVAKIYDPLYYGFADPQCPLVPRDVATEADRAYCAEVAAYRELERLGGFEGNEVARFHGSWTFELSSREVRMILTEHVRGKSMAAVRTDLLPEAEKLAAVGMVMGASARMAGPLAGVGGDVVVCGLEERVCSQWAMSTSSSSSCCARVVFVDLSQARVRRLERRVGGGGGGGGGAVEETTSVYRQYGQWVPAHWQHPPLDATATSANYKSERDDNASRGGVGGAHGAEVIVSD